MGDAANIRAIQALTELRNALGRFAGNAQEALRAAELEIRRTQEWLREREAHWQREVEKARRAYEACLRWRDEEGRGPSCAAEEAALRWAEAELRKVQYWRARVERAVAEYRRCANRLKQLTTTYTEQAQALLERKREELEAYVAVPVPPVAPSMPGGVEAQVPLPDSASGISWAEKQAILKKIDDGLPITVEDLRKLEQPICDLQTGTLEEDIAWVQQLLESERYREAMRDSREAQNLREALLATLKALNYWRTKP